MRNKITFLIICVLASCGLCLGQTTFEGLTPGQSTCVDAERVLGKPVKQVSATLIEYAPRTLKLTHAGVTLNSGKIFVQYRDDGSARSIVERIELLFCPLAEFHQNLNRDCKLFAMLQEYDPGDPEEGGTPGGTFDARQFVPEAKGYKNIRYFGPPRYMTRTGIQKKTDTGDYYEDRWAFYSRELYEAVAPKGNNCTGTLRGEWETNRGRMTITRVNEYGRVQGTYSTNNGTFTGVSDGIALRGEWKDNTGSGTMWLHMEDSLPIEKEFKGRWKRTLGNGPSEGVWEGRCVETPGGNQ